MEPLDPKKPESFARIAEIIARIAPEWKGQPNIIDIVPALKSSSGRLQTDRLVIGFRVAEKVRPELLADRGYKPIPPEIEGVPTDVILARTQALGSVDTKDTRSQMFDTLVGGIAVGNANMNAYGTFGMTLLAGSDSHMVAITNEHVLVYDGDGQVDDEVQQPRFYLNSEVSLDASSCCPNGELHYRGVDNPIIDAATAVFAAAAIAAACSDEIDPHRRGQTATVPDPGERTLREVVSVSLDYLETPFPGRPYKVGIQWDYKRETDRRVMEYTATELKQNEHYVDFQHLVTDKRQYRRGETVTFLALLGSNADMLVCPDYFVTAAALSPSHRRAYKVILRPYHFVSDGESGVLTHGETTHRVANNVVRRCYDFHDQKVGDYFHGSRVIEGNTYNVGDYTARFMQTSPSDPIGLRFPFHGLDIQFHLPVQRVIASVLVNGSTPVTLTVYSGSSEVGSAVSSSAGTVSLDVSAGSIDHISLKGGGGESRLLGFCVESIPLGHYCLYKGTIQLSRSEELGPWKTFLFAQTRNTVPVGTDPTVAAQTIGGLPVTDNFVDLGQTYNITYGNNCNVGINPNGDFSVVRG